MGRDEERLEFLKSYEKKLIEEGTKLIVGIDEAGRGPLAGPVSVGAVIMKPESILKRLLKKEEKFYMIELLKMQLCGMLRLLLNLKLMNIIF